MKLLASCDPTDLGLLIALSLGFPRATRGPGGGWASIGGPGSFFELFFLFEDFLSFLESFKEGTEELVLSVFLLSSPLVLLFLSGSDVGSLLVEPLFDLADLKKADRRETGERNGEGRGRREERKREREREREWNVKNIKICMSLTQMACVWLLTWLALSKNSHPRVQKVTGQCFHLCSQ